jgi:hypothetical protein
MTPPKFPYDDVGMKPELTTQLTGLVTGAWAAQAVSVAATLGVADQLADGRHRAEEIAETVEADPDALYRLLRALSGLGLVEEFGSRRFVLTELGELLRTDAPESLRGLAMMVGAPWHRRAWTDLIEGVRTGESPFVRLFGGWEYFSEHPEDGEVLNNAMTSASKALFAPVVRAYDFGPFTTIVDVGGGHGALLATALSEHPTARGVLFDLPSVIEGAGAPLREADVADRCELIGGDFFEAVPSSGDAYLLSNIIHDWGDEQAVKILANCRAAMNDGGHVLLCEAVLPDTPNQPGPATLIDLEMLVMGPGARQRTTSEFERLSQRADLKLAGVTSSEGGAHSILDAVAA